MMKLLYIPTGNVFTLPDEDALRYRNSDPANYRILDAGFVEQEEPVKLEPQTVQELVMQDEEEETEEVVESVADAVIVEDEQPKEDLTKLSKDALVAYCKRLGIKGVTKTKMNKQQMIELIEKATIDNVVGE